MNKKTDLLNIYNDNALNYSYTNSSYDRQGKNKDYDTFLYKENNERVIMDVKGCGCITRIFLPTSGSSEARLKIYVDDILWCDETLENIFTGKNTLFDSELVYITNPKENKIVEQSGYTSYVQIPFKKRVKIFSDSPSLFYYHINYTLFNDDNNTLLSNEEYKGLFSGRAVPKINSANDNFTFTINGKKVYNAAEFKESGTINGIKFKITDIFEKELIDLENCDEKPYYSYCITPYGYKILNNIYIKCEFDDEGECVYSPLTSFFGLSSHGVDDKAPDYLTKSIFTGVDDDLQFYFNFPMPFLRYAKISFENKSNITTPQITVNIFKNSGTHEKDILYFKTSYVEFDYKETDLRDMELLKLSGRGSLVGVVMSMDTDATKEMNKQYLEGDEHIYIDNSKTPQHNGTGTEDFFNGAYYWAYGTHSKPLSGCMFNTRWGKYSQGDESVSFKSSAYRYMLNDRINFHNKLVFNLEHGSWSTPNTSREFGNALFLYYIGKAYPADTISLKAITDEIVVSQYEGYTYGEQTALYIERLKKNSKKSITIEIPDNTNLILLRRTLDYSVENQDAEIYVDNKLAGNWYTAGHNEFYKFRTSDFVINKSYFENKKTATIDIDAVSEEFNFNSIEIIFL